MLGWLTIVVVLLIWFELFALLPYCWILLVFCCCVYFALVVWGGQLYCLILCLPLMLLWLDAWLFRSFPVGGWVGLLLFACLVIVSV